MLLKSRTANQKGILVRASPNSEIARSASVCSATEDVEEAVEEARPKFGTLSSTQCQSLPFCPPSPPGAASLGNELLRCWVRHDTGLMICFVARLLTPDLMTRKRTPERMLRGGLPFVYRQLVVSPVQLLCGTFFVDFDTTHLFLINVVGSSVGVGCHHCHWRL